MKNLKKILSILSVSFLTGFLIVLMSIGVIRSQVQMASGLAVAQSATKWIPLKDASVGDNITEGIGAFSLYLWDGANFDSARGDTTYGLDVDVTRLGSVSSAALADNTANPTTISLGSYLMLFDGTTWDRALLSAHGDNLTTTQGLNVAGFNYFFDGTNWDRGLLSTHGDNLTTAYGQNAAAFQYGFDGTNWDRILLSSHGDNLTTVSGQNVASFGYVFDGTNWDRVKSNVSPAPSGNLVVGNSYTVNTVLLASAARGTSGDSGALTGYGNFKSAIIQLNVTAQSGTTPTLDVYIDTTTDGTNWTNIVHFTQFSAATGRRAIQISENTAGGTSDFDATTDLAAGTVRQGPWGSTLRVRWVIGGSTPSFTFDVTGTFKS